MSHNNHTVDTQVRLPLYALRSFLISPLVILCTDMCVICCVQVHGPLCCRDHEARCEATWPILFSLSSSLVHICIQAQGFDRHGGRYVKQLLQRHVIELDCSQSVITCFLLYILGGSFIRRLNFERIIISPFNPLKVSGNQSKY